MVSNFERISDHAENVVEFALRMQTAKATISDAGLAELKVMADTVMECLDVSMEIFEKEKFSLLPGIA